MNREIKPGPRKGLVIINTGNGKGKTTAALGLLMRARGRDFRVVMLQFLKSRKHTYGEHLMAEKMGVEIIPLGDGFTWESQNIEIDKALARECWQECRKRIESAEYDIVILDELTYPITYGWLPLDEVIEVLKARNPEMHIVITGRNAPKELIEFADLVSEINEIKHPFKRGIVAQAGIEL
ncbi:MAG TPA: cob(I)yrinic acid a,c-diamide adenosyltransferase [Blastocatellia bacterium]|nr:cob(I)yrinic acid a,c-diamide adenosyltransferase [Blastocatellia bacterium]